MAALQELATEAQRLSEAGKFAEAADKYDEILKANEKIAEVHLNKGVALSNAGDMEGALEAFVRAGELKPELVAAHSNAGNIFKRLQRNKEAAEAYRNALDLDESSESTWSNLAHVLNAQDKFEEVLEVVTEALRKIGKTHIPLHNERIFALFKLGKPDDAIDDVEAILEVQPMEKLGADQKELYSMILGQKGSRLLAAGDPENAEPYLERACEGDSSAGNLFPYGVCLLHLGKDDDAVPILKKAMELEPENWRIPVALGTLYMRQKKFEEAIEMFERAMEHDEPKKDSVINFNYAVALMNAGRDEEAREPLELVVAAEPENHVALGLLGTLYLQNNEYENAAETLQRAADIPAAKNDSSIFYNLGYAKLMMDKPDDALEDFEQALEINPKSEQAAAAVKSLKPEQMEKKRMSKRDIEEITKVAQRKGASPIQSEEDMVRAAQNALSPLERAKAMLVPQRPPYLRRKSMEGIQLGYVVALATVYDEMREENLRR